MGAGEGLVDIHAAVGEDAIAEAAAGVDQQGADAAGGAFIDGVGLDAADLGDVDEFVGIERGRRPGHSHSPDQRMRARIQQMPIYEYNCRKCESKFEKLVKNAAAADNVICPECGSKDTAKALSVFAAVASAGGKSSPTKGMCGRCGGPGPCGMG